MKEQSGLFAEERYSVEADNITLVGGAIASNTPGNSTIRTNNIAFSDIENSSDYSAASGSISGGYSQGGGVSGGTGVPMYDGGDDKTLTKATITNGTIILNKDTNPTETTAEALGINTDLSEANKQIEAPKDVGKLLKEQKSVQEAMGHVSKAVSVYSHNRAKEAHAQLEKAEEEMRDAEKSGDNATLEAKRQAYYDAKVAAEAWGEGGSQRRKVEATVATLNVILSGGSAGQAAVAALSPELNAQIHELTKDSKTANLLAHAVLSALEAKVSGTSATAGAVAGVVGEGSAMLLAEVVFNKPASQLTAGERELLKIAGQLAGALSGQAVGGTTADTMFGLETAKRAVENNYLFKDEQLELNNLRKAKAECVAQGQDCSQIDKRIRELDKLDKERNYLLDKACQTGNSKECQSQVGLLAAAFRSYDKSSDAINPEFRNAFLDVATRFGEKREQYMGDVTIEALANLHIDSVKSMTELTELLIKAREGDSTAIEQLANMGKELGRSLVSPLDSMEKSYQDQMAEADKLEAQGKMREADVKRMEAFLSTQLAAMSTVSGGAGLVRSAFDTVGKLAIKKGVLSNKEVNIEWGRGIQKQGKAWEEYLYKILPKGSIDLNEIKPNFKTFDRLLDDGTAISAKTMDTVGSKTYQDPKRITYQLNRYVDDMVNFKEDGRGNKVITSSDISSREMYLAIPYSTTKQQMEAINKSIDYARSQGVKIIVKEVK